jgi:hypothetical protein
MGEYQTPAYNIVPRRRRRRGPFLLARQKKKKRIPGGRVASGLESI